MRTTYFTCILICFISLLTTTAQNKSTAYDSLSKINMISHPHTAPISNEVLLQYKKELNQDAEKHRAFMEKYYENFNKLFRIIAIAIGVGLTFFGFASFIQIKQAVKNVFESEYERQIQNKLKSYEDRVNTITERFEAIDKKVEEKFDKVDAALNYLEEAIKRQSRLNALQEASIIRQRKKLSSQYKITKSVNILKYLDAEGKRVQLERTQTLIGISKSNPVQTLIEFAGTSSEGENAQIKVVEKDENTEIIEESKKALQLTTYLKDYLKLGETLKKKSQDRVYKLIL